MGDRNTRAIKLVKKSNAEGVLDIQPEVIRNELTKILSSSYFSTSERLKGFLSYVVEEALAGRADRLKGYTIGLAVFDRAEDFDPQSDPAVRIVAGRLRQNLERYYQDEGKEDRIRINLPKGHYVPTFEVVPSENRKVINSRQRVVEPAEAGYLNFNRPSITVLPFKNLSSDLEQQYFADGICEEIIVGLTRFQDYQVITNQSATLKSDLADDSLADAPELSARYILNGRIRSDSQRVRVTAKLTDTAYGSQLWAENYDCEQKTSKLFNTQSDISTRIVAKVADNFGAIPRFLSNEFKTTQAVESCAYNAVLQFNNYVCSITQETFLTTYDAIEKGIAIEPDNAQLRAMLAELLVDEYLFEFIAETNPLELALEEACKAVALNPVSQHAHFAMGRVYCMQRKYDLFFALTEKIIELNPSSAYLIGNTGWHMALAGEWEQGIRILNKAIELNPFYPAWFNVALFFNHFRKKEYQKALSVIQMSNVPGDLRAGVFRAAALAQLGHIDEAEKTAAEIIRHDPNIVRNTTCFLERQHIGGELFERFVKGLRKAGLSGSFPTSEGSATWLVDKWEPTFDYSGTPSQIEYIPLRKASKRWHLGVSFPHIKDPYWLAAAYGVLDQAKILGVDVNLVEAGGYFNIEEQARQIEDCTKGDVDGLLIGAASFDKFRPLLTDVGKRMPVFSLINPIQDDLIETLSAVDWARMGSAIGSYLAGKHPVGTKRIRAAWLPGPETLRWVQDSDRDFKAAVMNSSVEIITIKYGDTGKEAQLELIKELLEEHRDIDCIVGAAVAIEAAIEELKRRNLHEDIKLYSDYLTPRVYLGILNGEVEATAIDFPILQARIAVDQAIRTLEGLTTHRHVGPAVFVIDKKNIKRFPVEHAMAPSSFTAEQINKKTVLDHVFRFAVINHPPYQINMGHEITGIDIELTKEILKRIGCKVVLLRRSLKRALQELEFGSVDIVGSMLRTSRAEDFAYQPKHHHSVMFELFVVSKKMGEYSTLEEFFEAGNRLALPMNTSYGCTIDDIIRKHPQNTVDCVNTELAFRMLAKKRVEGVILDPSVAKYHLERLLPKDDCFSMIRAAPVYLAPPSSFYMLFSKRNVPSSIVSQYNEELSLMQERGEYEEIIRCFKD